MGIGGLASLLFVERMQTAEISFGRLGIGAAYALRSLFMLFRVSQMGLSGSRWPHETLPMCGHKPIFGVAVGQKTPAGPSVCLFSNVLLFRPSKTPPADGLSDVQTFAHGAVCNEFLFLTRSFAQGSLQILQTLL